MLRFLLLGSLLGLFSGVVPGPFSALIAATALRRGFMAGFWIAVVPLASETVVMSLSALFLSQLPDQALRWMGFAGGVLVFLLAWRTYRESDAPPEAEPLRGSTWRMMEGALLAILSPAPWAFWLIVGSPLFLAAYHQGWGTAAAFLGSFLFWLVGIHLTVAGMAAYGRKRVSPLWHRRLMVSAAVALALAGVVLLWQSWVGNFHRMVTGTETLRSLVDSLPGP
jgi:threonine/homoserine/homoserine lactone efflux protein